MSTGNRPSAAMEYPALGSLAARVLPSRRGMPPYITFAAMREGAATTGTGYLGPAFGPFEVEGEPGRGRLEARGVSLPAGMRAPRPGGPRRVASRARSWPAGTRRHRSHDGPRRLPPGGHRNPPDRSRPVGARPGARAGPAPRQLRPEPAGAGDPGRAPADRSRCPVRHARVRRLGHARRQLPHAQRPSASRPGQGALELDPTTSSRVASWTKPSSCVPASSAGRRRSTATPGAITGRAQWPSCWLVAAFPADPSTARPTRAAWLRRSTPARPTTSLPRSSSGWASALTTKSTR